MTAPAQIGLYWGADHFSVVETANGQIANIFHIPFDTPIMQDGVEAVPDELKFPTLLQKTFEFRSVKTTLVNICIPAQELIFRSFGIPHIDPKDVGNVIEFEVTKYIPIKLEELTYAYHTVPYVDNSRKYLRVLFVAIRKTRLAEMIQAVTDAGLTVQNIEPAPVSLIHLLKRHNIVQRNKATAVLEISGQDSEIIVVESETLQFMRKLSISLDHSDLATLSNSIQNEARVSFNFYNRQNVSGKIDHLVILSKHKMPGIVDMLKKELNIPVSLITIDAFIPLEEFQTSAHAAAYGSALRKERFSSRFFDLSEKAIALRRAGADSLQTIKQYGVMAGVLGACVLAAVLTVIFSNRMLAHHQEKIRDLAELLGPYQTLAVEELNAQKQKITDELQAYLSAQPSSRMSVLLLEIPKLLPKGMWLTGFQVSADRQKSSDSGTEKFKITLNGKIYSADSGDHLRILNDFIETLKNHETINVFYDDVKRESAASGVEGDYQITTFSVTCG